MTVPPCFRCLLQVKGAEKVLFGLDDVVGTQEIVMVEGEMDKLALEEAGFKNVVSVSYHCSLLHPFLLFLHCPS